MACRSEEPKGYVNKWMTVAACTLIQLSAGLPYSFGLFSPALKRHFGWSQAELAGFGTTMNIGAFAAFLPGIALWLLDGNDHGPRCGLL